MKYLKMNTHKCTCTIYKWFIMHMYVVHGYWTLHHVWMWNKWMYHTHVSLINSPTSKWLKTDPVLHNANEWIVNELLHKYCTYNVSVYLIYEYDWMFHIVNGDIQQITFIENDCTYTFV